MSENTNEKQQTVSIGDEVQIQYLDNKQTKIFKIVQGSDDPSNNILNTKSPLANAVMDCLKGDIVELMVRGEEREIQIISFKKS